MTSVRIGVLGAARITPLALIEPARSVSDVAVAALAARDVERARRFAGRHGVPTVHASYDALLADPEIDAVYVPLPNGLHGRWTIAALEAGKHVLCEKPFTANAEEAEAVAAVARRTGGVVMQAFHYRYHALTRRMLEIIGSGELGEIRRLEARFCIPLPIQDIRWDLQLAGGSLMDTGGYAIHLVRTLAGGEPVVRKATAKLRSPGVDRFLQAELEFADGRTGSVTASMLSPRLLSIAARVIGSRGTMEVSNFLVPQYWHRLTIRTPKGRRKEQVARRPTSYEAQLQAFASAVLHGEPILTDLPDAIANMRVIDACYAAAGLPRREPTPCS
jgi:predicted dehydrogenase